MYATALVEVEKNFISLLGGAEEPILYFSSWVPTAEVLKKLVDQAIVVQAYRKKEKEAEAQREREEQEQIKKMMIAQQKKDEQRAAKLKAKNEKKIATPAQDEKKSPTAS